MLHIAQYFSIFFITNQIQKAALHLLYLVLVCVKVLIESSMKLLTIFRYVCDRISRLTWGLMRATLMFTAA